MSENVDYDPWLACYQPEVTTQIYINPVTVEKYAFAGIEGATFEVEVRIHEVVDFYGFDFNLTWNSTLIKFTGVEYTSQLDQVWSHWTMMINETGTGWYRLMAFAHAPAAGFDGSPTLAKLTFRIEFGPCYIEPDYKLQTRIHFAHVKLSDSEAEPICAKVQDGKYIIYAVKPHLKIHPNSVTCRKLGEDFTVQIRLLDAFKVCGFDIEIHYNVTLLEVKDVQWGNLSDFLPGPYTIKDYTVSEVDGLIRFLLGEEGGTPLGYGDGTLAEITFTVIKTKMWKKNCAGWNNNIQDSIAFTNWNISVSCPDLHFLTGELVYITDAEYWFISIQGDIDSDGDVDILDLRIVAYYNDVKQGDPDWTEASKYDLNCDNIIDLYDLVLIATNFGYEYDC